MRWILTWLIFWIGHGISLIAGLHPELGRLYPVYNWFLIRSLKIQGEGDGPWSGPVSEHK